MAVSKKNLEYAIAEWENILGPKNVLSKEASEEQYGKTTFPQEDSVLGALKVASIPALAASVPK